MVSIVLLLPSSVEDEELGSTLLEAPRELEANPLLLLSIAVDEGSRLEDVCCALLLAVIDPTALDVSTTLLLPRTVEEKELLLGTADVSSELEATVLLLLSNELELCCTLLLDIVEDSRELEL